SVRTLSARRHVCDGRSASSTLLFGVAAAQIAQPAAFDVERATGIRARVALRTGRKAQPASCGITAGGDLEVAIEDEQLDTAVAIAGAGFGARRPTLEPYAVGESFLLVERLAGDAGRGRRQPVDTVRVDDDVAPIATGVLAQLHEEHAAGLRKRRVAESLG